MPALEILQDVGELGGDGLGIQREDPVDDMIRAGLVGRVEIAGSVAGLNGRTVTRAGSGRR
jgi:hypothetical protein